MVWSDDVGGIAAKAFAQSGSRGGGKDDWTDPTPADAPKNELELAGDELTGAQIAAVFSIVSGRQMHYRRGPPTLLLRCLTRDGYQHTRYQPVRCTTPSTHANHTALRVLISCENPQANFEMWSGGRYIEEVGYCANVGQCQQKYRGGMHTLEQALRKNGWEGKPSTGFQQRLCSCHTPDMWVWTCCCPFFVVGWVADRAGSSSFGC
eukprot:COSAG01_NODE_12848_length_1676_cov_1.190869_3_plen_206_part_01